MRASYLANQNNVMCRSHPDSLEHYKLRWTRPTQKKKKYSETSTKNNQATPVDALLGLLMQKVKNTLHWTNATTTIHANREVKSASIAHL